MTYVVGGLMEQWGEWCGSGGWGTGSDSVVGKELGKERRAHY